MSVEFHGNGTSLSSHETPSYLLIMKLSMKLLSKLALATHFRNVAGIFFHFLVTLFFRFIIEGDNAHESRIRCAIMTQQCFVSLAMKFNIFYFFCYTPKQIGGDYTYKTKTKKSETFDYNFLSSSTYSSYFILFGNYCCVTMSISEYMSSLTLLWIMSRSGSGPIVSSRV